jgi:hypothetical protein
MNLFLQQEKLTEAEKENTKQRVKILQKNRREI